MRYDFFLDQKVTCWMRTCFTVDAQTEDQARAMAIAMHAEGGLDELPWELVEGTHEPLSPDENGGMATEEMFDHDTRLVITNEPSTGTG